ncbi:hypothetical protein EV360DRAFT_95067 [Lentinula raphanica]|nr:hypothetical protein EV360DRAFT_95067 [Lentinula raphanica]
MPLDGHSYLVAQGWSGKGNGLRKGAIAKPITVNQKKTLAGLGKDRDEAFPFWDHLFSAASQAIKVKIDDSDASDSDELQSNAAPTLRRTATGILSNRRPVDVTPSSTSGITTPDRSSSEVPRLSLIAIAKREAARRNLYSKFYRGAILISEEDEPRSTSSSGSTTPPSPPLAQETVLNRSKSKGKGKEGEQTQIGEKKEKKRKKKRKVEDIQNDEVEGRTESKEERRERKRRKKEAKEAKAKIEENRQVDEVRLKSKLKKKKRRKTNGGDESSLEAEALEADDSRQKQEKTERTKKRDKGKRSSESEPLSSSHSSKKKRKTS